MLLRVSVPVEAGNGAIKAGKLGSTVEKILAKLKPEAVYFLRTITASGLAPSCSI